MAWGTHTNLTVVMRVRASRAVLASRTRARFVLFLVVPWVALMAYLLSTKIKMGGGWGDRAFIASVMCWRALVTAISSVLLFVESGICKEKKVWRVSGVWSVYM